MRNWGGKRLSSVQMPKTEVLHIEKSKEIFEFIGPWATSFHLSRKVHRRHRTGSIAGPGSILNWMNFFMGIESKIMLQHPQCDSLVWPLAQVETKEVNTMGRLSYPMASAEINVQRRQKNGIHSNHSHKRNNWVCKTDQKCGKIFMQPILLRQRELQMPCQWQ